MKKFNWPIYHHLCHKKWTAENCHCPLRKIYVSVNCWLKPRDLRCRLVRSKDEQIDHQKEAINWVRG